MSEHKYEIIEIENWKRKIHCQIFRNAVQPQYCISFELDITHFHSRLKQMNWSFTFAMIYAVTRCANEIEEFRYRFKDGNVVLYERINTSFTYMDKETELFKVVVVDMQDCIEDYIEIAGETEKTQKEYFTGPIPDDVYQFSSMPWVAFTHVSHTDSGKKENAVPTFDWGKFFERDGTIILPFSVQVHHSFVDGIHIGKFVEKLQNYLNQI